MKKWEFPPITEKMVDGVNKEVEEEKKNAKDEPRFIQLGLMNGEIIKIPLSDIECLQMFGISENHYFTSGNHFLEKYKFCSRAYLKLSKQVSSRKYNIHKGMTIYERLTDFNDVSDITYLNQTCHIIDRILVPWSDMSCDGLENGHQFTRVDRQGNLEIIFKGD